MPLDSYVLDYFKAQSNSLRVGAPVYFVVKSDFDYASNQRLISSHPGSIRDSLNTLITEAATIPNASYLANAPSSWLDDYIDWANPGTNDDSSGTKCCRLFLNGSFCPSTVGELCTIFKYNLRFYLIFGMLLKKVIASRVQFFIIQQRR